MTVSPKLPALLRETLVESKLVPDVGSWWADLDHEAQAQLVQLWEECALAEGTRELEPHIEGYVTEPWFSRTEGFWHNDFYDYIVNHEIVYFEEHHFHVCTQHPLAKAAIESGLIPANLSCELGPKGCQMQRALSILPPGAKALRLRLMFQKAR